ncbi:MAG: TonB-dependent receptor [Gammaproteobacteria bacterium]|nr:TonB-dependent receptor [Gammaproteobacteria bacterium]
MANHSFFERNVLWECLPDGWCPGVPVGGLTPRGLKADFRITEGPSERDIETMEVRAVSSADGNEFIDWVAGVWYENANHRRGSFFWWDTDDPQLIEELQAAEQWTGGCPEVDVAGGVIFHKNYTINNQDEKTAYGEVGFNFTEQLKFTVGYRRSQLSTNFTRSGDLGPCWYGDGPGGRASPWQDVDTYRFNVDYHVSDDIMLFAFAANGYRPGGVNLIEYNTVDGDWDSRVEVFTPYESDAVWNYEAGVRSAWDDGRLVLNGSIYRIDWADMQSPTFRDYAATQGRFQQSGRSLVNIGESEVIGIEAMGIYAVNDNLELTLHLGWKDSEILDDQRQNFVGLPLPGSTSGVQFSVLADWAQDTALGELRANATFRSVPERWGHFTKDNPNEPYTMMDASVSLRRGSLELSVFLDNVFDDREIVWQTPGYPGWPGGASDWRDQFVGYYAVLRPRTLSLSVGVDL